jgi:hypothetical protein
MRRDHRLHRRVHAAAPARNRPGSALGAVLLLAGLLAAGCSSDRPKPEGGAPEAGTETAAEETGGSAGLGGTGYSLDYASVDEPIAPMIDRAVRDGMDAIRSFFGMPFRDPVEIRILPDRDAFNQSFPTGWGMNQTECWMVAVGAKTTLWVLTPLVWKEQACEHDPADTLHIRNLIAHELVHAFHGQYSSAEDFAGMEPLAWFVEGLAVYVSGQLDEGRLAPAREAVEKGEAPEKLADAWSGKYRYGVCGSLVQYLDVTYGRDAIVKMLEATTREQILDGLGVTETELLDAWRTWVTAKTS